MYTFVVFPSNGGYFSTVQAWSEIRLRGWLIQMSSLILCRQSNIYCFLCTFQVFILCWLLIHLRVYFVSIFEGFIIKIIMIINILFLSLLQSFNPWQFILRLDNIIGKLLSGFLFIMSSRSYSCFGFCCQQQR